MNVPGHGVCLLLEGHRQRIRVFDKVSKFKTYGFDCLAVR